MRWGGVHVESRTRNECCAGSQITGIATALYVTAVIHHIHIRFRSALPSSAMLKTGFPLDFSIQTLPPLPMSRADMPARNSSSGHKDFRWPWGTGKPGPVLRSSRAASPPFLEGGVRPGDGHKRDCQRREVQRPYVGLARDEVEGVCHVHDNCLIVPPEDHVRLLDSRRPGPVHRDRGPVVDDAVSAGGMAVDLKVHRRTGAVIDAPRVNQRVTGPNGETHVGKARMEGLVVSP